MHKVHNIEQGSESWHKFRSEHFGASEASAMLGISPYKKRDDLLLEKYTGIQKEVSPVTEGIFAKGHQIEKLALPIVENIIGMELYPVTVSRGKLSASCDGLSMCETVAWENKQYNASHFQKVLNGELPEIHWPQCQQVLHVTGAEKIYFTISDGTPEKTAGLWVYPDNVKIQKLLDGWKIFEDDLLSFVAPVMIKKVEASLVQNLPVPSIVVKGEITVSNLDQIAPVFDSYLESIKTELTTDSDFADAEANAKNCREMAKRIEALQENIIGQMVTVNEANGILENYKKAFNAIGLRLEKAVKEQKEMLKTQAIMKAKIEYADFVTELNKGIAVQLSQKLACPDFATEIKGVKTLETMQSRINSALANGKVEATTLANDVKSKLAYISESSKGYEHLVNVHAIVFGDIDYIKLHIQSVKDAEDVRRAKHEAAIKEQAEADARAKIEAEAKAKEAAEIKARQELEAQIIAEANAIPDGDAITNAITDTVTLGTGVMSVSVNEQNEVKANHIPAVQVGSVRPTAQSIINLVAKTYNVDTATANRWLAQSFGELKAA